VDVTRVVTGHDAAGRSVFVAHEKMEAESAPALSGVEIYRLGGTASEVRLPVDADFEKKAPFFPGLGESRFYVVRYPGVDSVQRGVVTEEHVEETNRRFPGLLDHFTADKDGMHRTDSVDYAIVIQGEMWLELDDGSEVRLPTGSCVVQNGTTHAWKNKSVEPAVVATVLLGVSRKSS
jgi:hypothetical protein